MRKLASLASASLAVTLLATPGPASGQVLARLYQLTPEPSSAATFEAALREHARWREAEGDPWSWAVYEVVVGDDVGDYIVRSPGHDWADFDAYETGFGPTGEAHFAATVLPLVESMTALITDTDTVRRHLAEDIGSHPPTLFSRLTYHLVPGREAAFDEVIDRVHAAVLETGLPFYYVWTWPVVGTTGPRATVYLLHEDWADFGTPERSLREVVAEVHGEEEAARLFEQLGTAYSSVETSVIRIRPDLAVEPDG